MNRENKKVVRTKQAGNTNEQCYSASLIIHVSLMHVVEWNFFKLTSSIIKLPLLNKTHATIQHALILKQNLEKQSQSL